MMLVDTTITDPLARINALLKLLSSDPAPTETFWDAHIYPRISALSSVVHLPSSPPSSSSSPAGILSTTRFLLRVDTVLCNRSRNLHGGAAASVFDVLTSIALAPHATQGRFGLLGVSRSLACTYLRPVPEGSSVVVTCEVVGFGGRLAMIRGVVREWDEEERAEKGAVMVMCEHGKVNTDVKL